MSVKATNHVRRLRGLNFAEGRAAFVLADHANHKTGEITISMQTLKEEGEFDLTSEERASVRRVLLQAIRARSEQMGIALSEAQSEAPDTDGGAD